MELKENSIMNRAELSEWFNIQPKSFSQTRENKLEELKGYCDFDLLLTPKGNFKGVKIKEVYCAVYGGAILKKKFLDWIEGGGLREVAELGGDNVISYPTVVNYYCNKNGIEYEGPHYLRVDAEGRTSDQSRKIHGSYKEENKYFWEWHYLYRQLKKYCMDKHVISSDWVDCCAGAFNPIFLTKTTEEDLQIREDIYAEIFDKITYTEIIELVEAIEGEENRDDILDTRLMRRMSDKEKRNLAAQKCVEQNVLFRKGYELI